MRAALDTNILAYAEGINGDARKKSAQSLIEKLPEDAMIPVQVLGELFQVLVRKAGRTPAAARSAVLAWSDAFPLVDTTASALLAATELAARQFSLWDAVILAVSAEANCRVLLSEDMRDGFDWQGVTIVNPFAPSRHPLLDALVAP